VDKWRRRAGDTGDGVGADVAAGDGDDDDDGDDVVAATSKATQTHELNVRKRWSSSSTMSWY